MPNTLSQYCIFSDKTYILVYSGNYQLATMNVNSSVNTFHVPRGFPKMTTKRRSFVKKCGWHFQSERQTDYVEVAT